MDIFPGVEIEVYIMRPYQYRFAVFPCTRISFPTSVYGVNDPLFPCQKVHDTWKNKGLISEYLVFRTPPESTGWNMTFADGIQDNGR